MWLPDRYYLRDMQERAALRLRPTPPAQPSPLDLRGRPCELPWCVALCDKLSGTAAAERSWVRPVAFGPSRVEVRWVHLPARCAVHREFPSYQPTKWSHGRRTPKKDWRQEPPAIALRRSA